MSRNGDKILVDRRESVVGKWLQVSVKRSICACVYVVVLSVKCAICVVCECFCMFPFTKR